MSTISRPIQYIIDVYGKQPETLDELAEACIRIISQEDKVVGFAWDIGYSDNVSNSHNSPIGQPTNWRQTDDKPKGYPGFYGRVWIRYANELKTFRASDNFRKTLTYTGAGGFGSYNGPWTSLVSAITHAQRKYKEFEKLESPCVFSWDYRFYLADFPKIHTLFDQKYTLHNLTYPGESFEWAHRFTWQDLEQIKKDQEVLNDIDDSKPHLKLSHRLSYELIYRSEKLP